MNFVDLKVDNNDVFKGIVYRKFPRVVDRPSVYTITAYNILPFVRLRTSWMFLMIPCIEPRNIAKGLKEAVQQIVCVLAAAAF